MPETVIANLPDCPATPWSRAVPDWAAHEDTNGPYSDFAAWKQWMDRQVIFTEGMGGEVGGSEIRQALTDMDYRANIALYTIMCKLLPDSERGLPCPKIASRAVSPPGRRRPTPARPTCAACAGPGLCERA